MEEIWRAIPGYEGWYDVSNTGDIRRVRPSPTFRYGTPMPRIMVASTAGFGYLIVRLCREGKPKTFCIHILVLMAFAGPKPGSNYTGNHKNGKKQDNRLENLEWLTQSENIKHAYRVLGRKSYSMGLDNYRARATWAEVCEARALLDAGMSQAEVSRKFNHQHAWGWSIFHRKTRVHS